MANHRTFEVHTAQKMYTIKASYFTASEMGVMFFDEANRGIGFAPNVSIDLVKINTTEEELHEAIRKSVNQSLR